MCQMINGFHFPENVETAQASGHEQMQPDFSSMIPPPNFEPLRPHRREHPYASSVLFVTLGDR